MSGYRKSSFAEAGEDWRKSSRSIGNGACVEAGNGPGGVLVRDTTDRDGGTLSFTAQAWAAFLARTAGSET